ncbi:hypothetical protein FNU76_06270 [Chitinimonas arctica]|uniref:Uncharacterized protein n=1 Tax=Chitinimonas arctica TaxID=2594795 RepID=A0A516SCV5_9NEIS|nr:hypothetical protein [Chitinimonas arctica]QDQ25987.1 hypothetical protein FNU76_06270 [Chitinimonas arctica]
MIEAGLAASYLGNMWTYESEHGTATSPGFESYDYNTMMRYGKEFDRFRERRTLEYVLDLHRQSDFALHQDHYRFDDADEEEDIEVVTVLPGPAQA